MADETTANGADDFEKMGWQKLSAVETPKLVTLELGSEEAIPLLSVENPAVTLPNHLVAGELRYANVAGTGYIEMWTVYANGDRYFSRTLSDSGPTAKMSAGSDWRRFMLPFQGTKDRVPVKLEINAILPGGGEIEFRNVALYQSQHPGGLGWWTPQQAAMVGGIAGAATGILGAMCGMMAAMGKARRFVMWTLKGIVLLGVSVLIVGIVALVKGQPYEVWYPLVILGAIGGVVGGITYPIVRKSFLQQELRLISAAK